MDRGHITVNKQAYFLSIRDHAVKRWAERVLKKQTSKIISEQECKQIEKAILDIIQEVSRSKIIWEPHADELILPVKYKNTQVFLVLEKNDMEVFVKTVYTWGCSFKMNLIEKLHRAIKTFNDNNAIG